jgi:hypothetical protein
MFELFVHKGWSPYRIARHFNQLRVDGSNGWTGSSIKGLLAGIDAIGIFVWNRRRREYDYEQEKIAKLVRRANAFLAREARKPRVDAEPMRAKMRDCQARIEKLVKQVEAEPDDALCDAYHARTKAIQKEINDLKAAIREAEARSQPLPARLDIDRAKTYLANLRGLLSQELPMAAEAIRTLTGPIRIREEKVPGKPGARWIAMFSLDLAALLRKVARDQG